MDVLGVDDGQHAVEHAAVLQDILDVEGLNDRRWVGETGGLDDNMVELVAPGRVERIGDVGGADRGGMWRQAEGQGGDRHRRGSKKAHLLRMRSLIMRTRSPRTVQHCAESSKEQQHVSR